MDSQQGRILVRAKEGWTLKTNQERVWFVPPETIRELNTYRTKLKHNTDDGWVFQNKLKPGERWRETGSSYTHEIRRAVASTMLLNGTAIHVFKEILGHSTIKTTELYAFTNDEAKKAAAEKGLV